MRLDHHVVGDDRAVEDHRAVTDDDIASDRAGVDHGIYADGDPVADDRRIDVVGDMDRRAVAEDEVVADPHEMAVGADDGRGAEPGVGANRGAPEDGRAGPAFRRRGELRNDGRVGQHERRNRCV